MFTILTVTMGAFSILFQRAANTALATDVGKFRENPAGWSLLRTRGLEDIFVGRLPQRFCEKIGKALSLLRGGFFQIHIETNKIEKPNKDFYRAIDRCLLSSFSSSNILQKDRNVVEYLVPSIHWILRQYDVPVDPRYSSS
jgi:hypothetical protein